ncbi:MAG: hypothetical protein HZB26_06050 [Candidatus Hydrogenedentes bacterium]|nr:hypothetical protein [Candidatus Hydrogenedentota bacterium]
MLSALQILATIVSLVLLVPYFGWGIFTLRFRYRFHEELNPSIEAVTLLTVCVFYAFEWWLLRAWMASFPIYLIFAALGLLVSGAALYGPMFISLLSHILVDLVMPVGESDSLEPKYGPAESLERQGDYEGAIQEYYIIARIFPKDPTTPIRIADNFMKLGRTPEAAPWFERGLNLLSSPEKSLPITNRLCEIYLKHLDKPQEVPRLLSAYLDRYPNAEYADSVRERLKRLTEQQTIVREEGLAT